MTAERETVHEAGRGAAELLDHGQRGGKVAVGHDPVGHFAGRDPQRVDVAKCTKTR